LCRTIECLFYVRVGLERKVRSLLARIKESPACDSPFFEIEQLLVEVNLRNASTEAKIHRLQNALQKAQGLSTLYQQCQILNELGVNLIVSDKNQEAQKYCKTALELAERNGYRPLLARAMLLIGIASEKTSESQRWILDAFQAASEMRLLELVAESAFC